MVLVAVAMIAIIAMAALSIDVVTLYLARMEAQRSADAAALTAARVISLSGLTGDPDRNTPGSWSSICGGAASPATQAATAAANQNLIGAIAPTVSVNYYVEGSSPSPDCSGLPAAFGVNPLVTVQITRTNLPTFFSRIWGNSGNTVNATAVAEAFNSSNSGNVGNAPTGTIIPVQLRCVKPWVIPNKDPMSPGPNTYNPPFGPPQLVYCDQTLPNNPGPCNPLVSLTDGSIKNSGISLNGTNTSGVIGETFWLSPDCVHTNSNCQFRPITNPSPPQGNLPSNGGFIPQPPSMQYVPGLAPSTVVAVPSCSSGTDMYQQAIAGCDQSTVYQCGVQNMNTVDLSENPGVYTGDTMNGVLCLTNQGDATDVTGSSGQDTLNPYAAPSSYPFQILSGSSNPLMASGLGQGTPVTASPSIVSFPIYDSANNTIRNNGGLNTITVVGFLQVFINAADQYGNVSVTVLNVTGCGNGSAQSQPVGTAVTGSSPVPIRLITPP